MVLVAGAVEVKQRKPGGSLNKRRTGRYAGRVRLAVAPDRSAESLGGFIERTVKPGAAIITDDWSGYAKLGIRGYCHTAVAERGDTHSHDDRRCQLHGAVGHQRLREGGAVHIFEHTT